MNTDNQCFLMKYDRPPGFIIRLLDGDSKHHSYQTLSAFSVLQNDSSITELADTCTGSCTKF